MAGRPLKFETPEALQRAVDAFFKECDDKNEIYTIYGLCLVTGLNRVDLVRYAERDQYCNIIKEAKDKVRKQVERMLLTDNNSAGKIFWLKNNADWKDQTEQTLNIQLPTIVFEKK